MIKFLDLQSQYQTIKAEIDAAIANIFETGTFIGGSPVQEFEEHFANYQQAKYCIGVGNGTDAIEIALEALDLPKGSDVIVPANSFIATSEAVTRSGHRVVFCDCDPSNYTLSVEHAKKVITPNTKAIVAVHLYGHPCDMTKLKTFANERQLYIIEDCAQAHGAEFQGSRIGAIGDIGTFSFYPGKVLGCFGDGGAIVTNNETLAKKCRMIANHGRISKYNHEFEGRNSRLDSIQAAILSVKLNHLDKWIAKRNQCANFYNHKLAGIDNLILPKALDQIRHAYHLYVIRHPRRDELQQALTARSIETGIHYPIALPKLQAYNYLPHDPTMQALYLDNELLSLPIGEHLSEAELEVVCDAVKAFCKN